MVALRQLGLRRHVVPEDAAVVDHPGDHLDLVASCRLEAELPRPRLERVEDDHRPVDRVAEALEAADQVERESVCRPGSDPDRAREAGVAECRHPLPDLLALVARAVRVVEEQQVEALLAEPLQAALGGHTQIPGVLARAAQRGIGEARESLRAIPLPFVEIVAHRSDEGVPVAVDALERAAEERIRLTLAIGISGEDRVDAVAWTKESLEAVGLDCLTEVKVTPSAPAADCLLPG